MKTNQTGFTLIELMIVISIIGILAILLLSEKIIYYINIIICWMSSIINLSLKVVPKSPQ